MVCWKIEARDEEFIVVIINPNTKRAFSILAQGKGVTFSCGNAQIHCNKSKMVRNQTKSLLQPMVWIKENGEWKLF
jgi:hypothetical protein